MSDVKRPELVCMGCGKSPEELPCYTDIIEPGEDVSDWVWEEEGTLNRANGHFLCDRCYINAGMPSAPGGWKCP